MLPSSFTIYSYSIQSPVLLNNCFTLFDLLKLPTSPPLAFHFIEKKWEQLGENVYYHYLPTDHLYFHTLPEFKFVSIDGLALFLCKTNHFLFIFAYSRISSKQFSHLSPISWNSLFLLDHFHQHPHKAIFMSSKKCPLDSTSHASHCPHFLVLIYSKTTSNKLLPALTVLNSSLLILY